jgi:nucleoside-diphosphate-sugar epimerase
MRVLVTGATGRVGKEVVAGLSKQLKGATVVAATRDPNASKVKRFSTSRRSHAHPSTHTHPHTQTGIPSRQTRS